MTVIESGALVPVDNMAAVEALDPQAREVAVTQMLTEARAWLAHAVESTGPQVIANFKAQMATVAEANLLGISMVLARYGVEPAAMVRALLGVRGGTKGLMQSANRIREATGCTRNDSFAAAMVEAYNRAHRGRGRLANWFASDEAAAS